MSSTKIIQVNIRVTQRQKTAWQKAAAQKGVTLRELVATAVDKHIKGDVPSPPPPETQACSPARTITVIEPFVQIKTAAGERCESVLMTLYPLRVSFTRAQISDAGHFIKRIGFDETLRIAAWAARNITLKDGRYGKWRTACFKALHRGEGRPEQPITNQSKGENHAQTTRAGA